jgi:hypothetical protein
MANLKLNNVLSQLENVRQGGSGFTSRCPSHDDKNNSLSITGTATGNALLHCHAGCQFQNIIAALNISTSDRNYQPEKKIKALYDYTDENENLLYQSVRYEPKDFRQRRPDGKGGWIWNLKDERLVLYRLPEVLASPLVYLVEGEKDVETLRSNDLVATCNPMGAGKWRDDYNESLRGKTVVILPDYDKSGQDHAEKVAQALYGAANEIVVVNLPNLPEKGDVTDYFENGGSVDELIDFAGRAESWKPIGGEVKTQSLSKFVFTRLSDLLNEPEEETSFVWDKTLPHGGLSICSAKPKVGKSTLARNLSVKIVEGEPFLNRVTLKGKVLYLCLEEKRSEVRSHFEKMGVSSDDILIHTGATPDNAFVELSVAIAEFEPVLVIIDPLSRVLRVRDFNDYAAMARGFEPLIDLARKTNCHILALHHDSKMERSGGDALLGSTAIFGAVDCHIQLKKRDKGRTISTTQRYGEDMPETVIELDKDTGVINGQGDFQSFIIWQAKDEIMRTINDSEELNESQIKAGMEGFSRGAVSKALRELVEQNKLDRKGEGKKGKPFIYSKK